MAKVSVNPKVFEFFNCACSLFSLSYDFFYKVRAWAALSVNLQHKKVRPSVGLKNELGMTPCNEQRVELRAFVSWGRTFLNTGWY